MKLKKITFGVVLALLIAGTPNNLIYANEAYAGKESEWMKRCSVAQTTKEAAKECIDFKAYYEGLSKDLGNEISNMQDSVSTLNKDMSNISEVVKDLQSRIDSLNEQIAIAESSLVSMKENIALLDSQMLEKEAEIEELDVLIKQRMIAEQASLGLNQYIDVLMGSENIINLLRLVDGINQITKSDREQIEKVSVVRNELLLQQDEQERLLEQVSVQIEQNEQLKVVADAGKVEQEKLYVAYQEKEASIVAALRSAQTDISSIQGNIASINTEIPDDIFKPTPTPPTNPTPEDPTPENPTPETPGDGGSSGGGSGGSTSFIKPVSYPWYCGTWHYPNSSSIHLGADYSGPSGAAVVAPAKAIVLYAANPIKNESGFLGNYVGFPAGGGNTIHLLTQVGGTTYGLSFYHLSQNGFAVSPGDVVEQGQRLALSGGTGNVTGPHLHFEVINLGSMSVSDARARFAKNADFAWGTGWNNLSGTCANKGSTPCKERPEDFF